jgi:acyl dehydratase
LPSCERCGQFDLGYIVASGKGTLYSFAVPHHPPAPGFRYPVFVGLIELAEGVRVMSNVVDVERAHVRVGMPLEVCWLDSHPALVAGEWDSRGAITLPQFRPVRAPRATTTRTIGSIAVGDELPLCPIPLNATQIASGALATRDFMFVHHDRDLAVRAGSKDIFMNIHTTLGLSQRYLDDWAGPDVLYENIRLRLGAPNYPGDTMTMTASVVAKDDAAGRVTVSFRGFNQLGDHAQGTADLLFPGGTAYDAFVKGA